MQRVQVARLNNRAIVRFLVLLAGFGLVAALLLWLKFAAADVLSLTLPAGLQDFVTLALSIVVEALPFVILGALVSVVIRLFAPTDRIIRRLPRPPLFRRLSISLLSTFMPVCECGNVPVARGLVIRGLSVSESTTFLLAAPIINPVTILAAASAFSLDPSIVAYRVAGALLIANLVGSLIALYKDQTDLVSKGFYNTICEARAGADHHHDHHRASGRWQEGIAVFRDEVSLMLKVLCLGAVIAGLRRRSSYHATC